MHVLGDRQMLASRLQILSDGDDINFVLTREMWEARRRNDIVIEGLEPCLELFGLGG